jgi:hypothetical protein|nr:hypothetical protein [Mucilaginibacter sp. E4BP6]
MSLHPEQFLRIKITNIPGSRVIDFLEINDDFKLFGRPFYLIITLGSILLIIFSVLLIIFSVSFGLALYNFCFNIHL